MALTTTPFPTSLLRTELPPQNIAAPTYTQATPATSAFGRHVVSRGGRLETVVWNLADDGTGGSLAFKMQKNGSDISGAATGTIASSGSHGVLSGIINCSIDVAAGDVIQALPTAVPSGSPLNLSYAPNVSQQF